MNGPRQTEVGQVLAYDLDPAVRPGKYQIQPENGESGWMGRNTERGGGGYLQKLLLKRRASLFRQKSSAEAERQSQWCDRRTGCRCRRRERELGERRDGGEI